ncbi:hypothetical protein EDC01DRAFT_128633 [Geopyxis carbonaria]|nr:hypothetical protein EDC01DRAFT_128633 [Geopyxis carbonaria]
MYFEDSSIILSFDEVTGEVLRSTDDGKNWSPVEDVKGNAYDIGLHPFDKKKAVIFGTKKTHWATGDCGKSWKTFEIPIATTISPDLLFHASNPGYVIFTAKACEADVLSGLICKEQTFYTKDWFKSNPQKLRDGTHGCLFAQGTKHFKEASESTILCVVNGKDNFREHRQLLISEDFFASEREPKLDGYNVIEGLVAVAAAQKFIVAAVRTEGTDKLALFVTDDTKTWHRVEFPHSHGGIRQDAYTLLESTPYSIQIDVLSGNVSPSGTLFSSNSNGTYFTQNLEDTNRIAEGLVDFEQIEGIEGIVLANIIKNIQDLKDNPLTSKKLQSRISFDDGRAGSWKPLKAGKEDLHLYSVTRFLRKGRVFSSSAPGILMGVGNTGEFLEKYNECDLYVSDDAGMTWTKSLTEAHKYRSGGSGSIIVAINDEILTNKVSYSLDHGKHWDHVLLEIEVRARELITTPDSTSAKFVLIGVDKDKKAQIFALDFTDVFERKCHKEDFEKWYARYEDEAPDCLMGHKQFYRRRKQDVKCLVDDLYNEPEDQKEDCNCLDHDFECDFNFVSSTDGKCELAPGAKLSIPADACKHPGDTYDGLSGYRKIPGNSCKGGIEDEKLKTVRRECKEANSLPSSGDIISHQTQFKAKIPTNYFYLENAKLSTDPDETIIMQTSHQEIWISHDHGMKWQVPKGLEGVHVVNVYPHTSNYNHIYLTTATTDLWFSQDRGRTFEKRKAPSLPYMAHFNNMPHIPVLEFHPENDKWLIWAGQKDCDSPATCHAIAYYTKDYETGWKAIKSHVGKCKWIRGQKQLVYSQKLIFCEIIENNSGHVTIQLVSTENFFEDEQVHFKNIKGFAKMEEFIIVASVNEDDGYLKAFASVDGKTFAHAQFPHDFNVPHETAYTVLDSVTHAIFLHVTVNEREGFEYGSLLKSNSNGTNYVLSLDAVNRNKRGLVDFEKMQSIEGVILANQVVNWKAAANGDQKQLRTMISYNDGGEWYPLPAPPKDSEGQAYKCNKECSLNLHHYTERSDPRHTFASASAVGLMMGIGNVGKHLSELPDGDTFLTTDGGLNWQEVKKGPYFWEYGDQGSIIVIVSRMKETDTVYYTLNEGKDWIEYKFGEKMTVMDLSTMPTDTSRRFLLWGFKAGNPDFFYTVHLDFTGITNQECQFNLDKPQDGDFYQWSFGGKEERCLFGHVTLYNRKIPEHRCYIGKEIPKIHKTLRNCTCTRADYECDFNYSRMNDGSCQLVDGLSKPDHAAVCKDKNVVEYYEPTGYRKLPMSTCTNNKDTERYQGRAHFCDKRHSGIGGFGLFLAITFPVVVAGAVGYYVWTQMSKGRFGTIRLGEDNDSPLIKYSIIGVSAIVTILVAIPHFLSTFFGWFNSKLTRTRRYTTRSSFSRGDYSIVNNDEGELLGSDDEEEI